MNTIHTDQAPAAIGPYSQAIVSGGMLYTSGQIPVDPATGNVVEGSDVSALVRGGSLTVNGITYKITNVTDGEVVNGNKTYQITAEAPMRSAAPPSGSGS